MSPKLFTILLGGVILLSACATKKGQIKHSAQDNSSFNLETIKSSVLQNNPDLHIEENLDELPSSPDCIKLEDTILKKKCFKNEFLRSLYTTMRYPPRAREKGIEGTVLVQFILDAKGEVNNIKIVKDPGAGLGDAVKTAIVSANAIPNKWIPGKINGIPVKTLYILPVKFNVH